MKTSTRPLGPGDVVVVRSEAEIRATLDEDDALDGLPLMPEMLRFCGRRCVVAARADRTVVERLGVRRMHDTVHLAELRCDGAAHGGCCRSCLLYWKEAWLRRVDEPQPAQAPPPPPARPLKTRERGGWYCQSSHLDRATLPRPLLHPVQELRAIATERLSPLTLMQSIYVLGYDIVRHNLGDGLEWNSLEGPCTKTPTVALGLKPGERVRVKPVAEILATLNARGHNRGMEFSREMLAYCGKEMVVLRRLERLIRDQSTRLVPVENTVILEGAVYRALNRRAVPRREYMFWRECWLERV
jgi:hypothetical protein